MRYKEEPMKQYLLSVYQPGGDPPPPEFLEQVGRDLDALNQELKAAGAWVFAGGLHSPSTATVVRLRDGDVLTTDGPFAEGKEHIGGFTIIRAPDLDAALRMGPPAHPGDHPPGRGTAVPGRSRGLMPEMPSLPSSTASTSMSRSHPAAAR